MSRDFSFTPSDRRLSFVTSLRCGREYFHLANHGPKVRDDPQDFLPLVDAFLSKHSFRQLRDWGESQWEILKRCDAVTLLAQLLSTDMAYNSRLRDQTLADAWAREYIGAFNRDGVFLTNRHVYESGDFAMWQQTGDGTRFSSSGQWITEATFESGVVALDCQRIGILWMTDED